MTEKIKRGALATRARRFLGVGAALVVLPLASCDMTVTNPGPVQELFLDEPSAQPALVNGMGRALSQGLNWVSYTGAAVAREIHPAGSTGSFGITVRWQAGRLEGSDGFLNPHWEQAQRARWLAEDGIRRIEDNPLSNELLVQAYVWAGYSNRLLGENFCQAVIDGGAPQDRTEFLNRAESWFTQAAQGGTGTLRTAALAGRASVRVQLGDWTGAVADAGEVPDAFEFAIPYFSGLGDATRNRIVWAAFSQPYRAHTQWNTKYAEIGFNAQENPDGDPRVPWQWTDGVGDAAIECCGTVPFWPQAKYPDSGAPITLSSGAEMRLIEAENLLRGGSWEAAIDHINDRVRTPAGAATVSAASETEAWAILKEERGIVLWLEGRRLGDLRRWADANTPGDLHPLEVPSGSVLEGSHLLRQDMCFPIPPSEQNTNPNVPTV